MKTLPFLSPYIADLDSAVGKFEIQLNLSGINDDFQRSGRIKVEDASLHTLLLSDPITQINGDALMIDNVLSINNLKALLHRNESRGSLPLKQNTEITGKLDFNSFFNPGYDCM